MFSSSCSSSSSSGFGHRWPWGSAKEWMRCDTADDIKSTEGYAKNVPDWFKQCGLTAQRNNQLIFFPFVCRHDTLLTLKIYPMLTLRAIHGVHVLCCCWFRKKNITQTFGFPTLVRRCAGETIFKKQKAEGDDGASVIFDRAEEQRHASGRVVVR